MEQKTFDEAFIRQLAREESAKVAERYGIPTANPDGTPITGVDIALLEIIQEYGGANSPQWRRFDEVPLDVVERAFEEYNLRGGWMGDKPIEQMVREMAREDVSGYPDDTQKIQDAYDEAVAALNDVANENAVVDKLVNNSENIDPSTVRKAYIWNKTEGKNLLAEAVDQQKDQENVFNRPEIGKIDVVWGDSKRGLDHIIQKRTAEGLDGVQFARICGGRLQKET